MESETQSDAMTSALWLHVLFFWSGVSGLIYQIVWVRQFGQIYGNTVYSASIVVAIFMLGLGAGSYVFGAMADRLAVVSRLRHGARDSGDAGGLVRLYAWLEVLIAAFGAAISFALPHLAAIVAGPSSYETGADGWQTLSTASYVWRAVLATLLLGPFTVLMGGTLTVLVRARVRSDLDASGWRIALLYGINTLGAAVGAFLTDFALVPAFGLLATQSVAVTLNLIAAAGAFLLPRASGPLAVESRQPPTTARAVDRGVSVRWASLALALSGFAVLGVEMLWLRHLGVLLGGFRAVLSLLLTVMLLALGIGALLGGWLVRRFGYPARTLIVVQGVFPAVMLIGLAANSADGLAAYGAALAASLGTLSSSSRVALELWFNLRPMLIEVALPSLVAGLAFPLANAIVQRTQDAVGRRAGVLYAANTLGAVTGALIAGYMLLPRLGMQGAAAVLAGVALLAIVPLVLASDDRRTIRRPATAVAALGGTAALVVWLLQPADFLIQRALGTAEGDRVLTRSEGVNELLAVVERGGRGRGLLTNGHAMSSTALLDQRYMRALAHIPLLSMDRPERVLVIGFGVGNTTHAATLHSSVARVDVVDLSRNILEHARFFSDANHDVLRDRRVSVFINDGRQHLQMAAPATYDLITLEPPPIAHAGVSSLYSREFYELARTRLKDGGYVSQWLPAYQVPAESSLAMVRAFIDVFPRSVLLSGAQAELLLVGTTAPRIELDPDRIVATLAREPAVRGDLARVDLGSVRDIAGTFVGSAETMARATSASPAVTDDRPLQEYGVRSGLTVGLMGVPASLFDMMQVAVWCSRCVNEGSRAPEAADLALYLQLLQQAYIAPVTDGAKAPSRRRIWGSAYLGAVVPDSAEVHNVLGFAHMRAGRIDAAIGEFETALAREPPSANARANLGQVRYEQGAMLMESRQFTDALPLLRMAIDLLPASAEAQNDLGVTLASMGRIGEALPHFERAVALKPDFTEARNNLQAARLVN